MKRALIIHGWESNPTEHWYQQEKQLLEQKSYSVSIPDMPNSFHPIKDEWVQVITDFAPDEESVLIGHSLGPSTIFRYLEKSGQKVDKVISIAGFVRDLGFEETSNFVKEPFDWEKIRTLVNKFVVIAQKNDPYIAVEVAKEVSDKTGGDWILIDGNNHFDTMDLDLINQELV